MTNIGKFKVMWFDRYFAYMNKPVTILNMFMLMYLTILSGMSMQLIGLIIVGLIAGTVIISRFDNRVLSQEMEYYARINPYFQQLEKDIKELKDVRSNNILDNRIQEMA